ncbi:hypothetical protein GW17_00047395 [Ensete ventricosum]|nr:hypothetical protein GW17_00047395 [Ensete ventricosum]
MFTAFFFSLLLQGIQADNGSVIYYIPGYQAGYTPYGPLLPGAMYGVDGQFLNQSYCPSPISPQALVSPGPLPQQVAYGPELMPAYPWDPSFFFADEIQGSRFSVDQTKPHYRPNLSSDGHTLAPSSTFPASKSAFGTKGSSPVSDLSHSTMIHNQTQKPVKKVIHFVFICSASILSDWLLGDAAAAVLSKGYDPVNKFNAYVNQGKGPVYYPNSVINMKENGQSWVDDEKLKVRNKLNSRGDLDLLNEQNRGPRTNGNKSTSQSDIDSLKTLGDKNDGDSISVAIINKDEYNRPDFQTKYEHALFFVIKSYSEDDIHKSIKYNVWASTPNGNKRLDNAFQVAQETTAEKDSNCPLFLFFSVNASGQFCGVAEMTGRVDFSKNMDFWQQDKWNGFFPVKWHIIKDVPNLQFRHIILENNDNKPVTNSRDTQEVCLLKQFSLFDNYDALFYALEKVKNLNPWQVKFSQGTELLSSFKSYSSKTSILDDFGFYENRQKAMQDKRNKPTTPPLVNSLVKPSYILSVSRLLIFNPKNVESTEVPKLGDSKSQPPNLVSVEVKEGLQTGIASRK